MNAGSMNLNETLEEIFQQLVLAGKMKERLVPTDQNHSGSIYESIVSDVLERITKLCELKEYKFDISTGYVHDVEMPESGSIFDLNTDGLRVSKQIDIILTKSDARYISAGQYRHYYIGDVIATIETKKKIDGDDDFASSILNCMSVSDLLLDPEKPCGEKGPIECKSKFSVNNSTLNYECEIEYYKPTTIIFGFDGYSKESTIRDKFTKVLQKDYIYKQKNSKSDEMRSIKPTYLYELPDLLFENDNLILKMNKIHYLTTDGVISYFCSANNINDLLKMYFLKIYILEAIARKLEDEELFIEIQKQIDFIPLKFNVLIDLKLENDRIDLIPVNSELKPSTVIVKKTIELSDDEYHFAEILRRNFGVPIHPNIVCTPVMSELLNKEIIFFDGELLRLAPNVSLVSTDLNYAYIIEKDD